jgi:hypothetical protein
LFVCGFFIVCLFLPENRQSLNVHLTFPVRDEDEAEWRECYMLLGFVNPRVLLDPKEFPGFLEMEIAEGVGLLKSHYILLLPHLPHLPRQHRHHLTCILFSVLIVFVLIVLLVLLFLA